MDLIKESNKQGNRPAKYKQSIMARLMELVAEGKTTRECVKELDVSWTTLRKWLNEKNYQELYRVAQSDQITLNHEKLDKILEDAHLKAKTKQLTMTEVKLIELIQKNFHHKNSKLQNHVWGSEKQTMSISDSKGREFKVEWSK
jgi:transposase|tara:strand:+ start:118 stop:549 length:432 start_codon:yes stop_codon:yes gene_type:complete